MLGQDTASYEFPASIDGVLSMFAMTLVAEYDPVIAREARAFKPGGRLAILDISMADGASPWLTKLGVLVARPFGATLDVADRHPRESVQRYLGGVTRRDQSFGFAYLVVGEALIDATQTKQAEVS